VCPANITHVAIKTSPNTFEKLVSISANIISEKNTGAKMFSERTLLIILVK
jgi:hypothetical protein